MIEVGYKDRYAKCEKNRNKSILFLVLSITLLIVDIALFLIFIDYYNFKKALYINLPILIIISLLTALMVVFVQYFKKEIKFMDMLFNQYINMIVGRVIEISETTSTFKSREAYLITVLEGNEKYILYFENYFGEVSFKVNDLLLFKTVDNFILAYEVKNNEIC